MSDDCICVLIIVICQVFLDLSSVFILEQIFKARFPHTLLPAYKILGSIRHQSQPTWARQRTHTGIKIGQGSTKQKLNDNLHMVVLHDINRYFFAVFVMGHPLLKQLRPSMSSSAVSTEHLWGYPHVRIFTSSSHVHILTVVRLGIVEHHLVVDIFLTLCNLMRSML